MKKIYNGIMFIGDPHLTDKAPKSRLDSDRFFNKILKKLEFCFDYCIENNLRPYILGDFLDLNLMNFKLINKNIALKFLKKYENLQLTTIVGNHEVSSTISGDLEFYESESTALMSSDIGSFIASGSISILDSELIELYNGQSVSVRGLNYGNSLPLSYPKEADISFLLTHLDLNLPDYFAKGVDPVEIENIDFVVNGHIHLTFEPVYKGSTVWYNPGNITRDSLTQKNHTPKVLLWNPDGFSYLAIPHDTDVWRTNQSAFDVLVDDSGLNLTEVSSASAAPIRSESEFSNGLLEFQKTIELSDRKSDIVDRVLELATSSGFDQDDLTVIQSYLDKGKLAAFKGSK